MTSCPDPNRRSGPTRTAFRAATGRRIQCGPDQRTPHGRNPALIGDLSGDWREEVVLSSKVHDELVILTTDQSTGTRLYTLAQNPAYRNGMDAQGLPAVPRG
ncbi:rhamnogalacturonan lyase family protein [Actinoplanes derwentensis]|uniref:rhamnogalacturonan lyase family protein n=1 Tax=Actinoplanes derwentensis TaxID=113562 RepID=UPI002F91B8DA